MAVNSHDFQLWISSVAIRTAHSVPAATLALGNLQVNRSGKSRCSSRRSSLGSFFLFKKWMRQPLPYEALRLTIQTQCGPLKDPGFPEEAQMEPLRVL